MTRISWCSQHKIFYTVSANGLRLTPSDRYTWDASRANCPHISVSIIFYICQRKIDRKPTTSLITYANKIIFFSISSSQTFRIEIVRMKKKEKNSKITLRCSFVVIFRTCFPRLIDRDEFNFFGYSTRWNFGYNREKLRNFLWVNRFRFRLREFFIKLLIQIIFLNRREASCF